jgi:hypothetical protein
MFYTKPGSIDKKGRLSDGGMRCMQYEARQLHVTPADIEVLDPRMLVPTVAADGQPDGGSRYALLQVGICVQVRGCERPLMSGSEPADLHRPFVMH